MFTSLTPLSERYFLTSWRLLGDSFGPKIAEFVALSFWPWGKASMYFRPRSAVLSMASKSVKRLNVQAWQPNRQPSFSACGAPLEVSTAADAGLSRASNPAPVASTPAVMRNDLRFMVCSSGNSLIWDHRCYDRPFGLPSGMSGEAQKT